MSKICPNINTSDWKSLEAKFGKQNSYKLFYANGGEIPSANKARDIINNDPKILTKFIVEGVELTSSEKKALFGGLKYYFIKNLINDLSSIEDISSLLDDITDTAKFQKVYEEALLDMINMLDPSDDRAMDIAMSISDDFPTSLVADELDIEHEGAHANLVLEQFKIEIGNLVKFVEGEDSELDVKSTNEETKDNWAKESLEQNRKDSFSRAIKLLISGIPKLNKSTMSADVNYNLADLNNYILTKDLQLEQPIDQSEVNNLLLNIFVNQPADINAFMRILNKERITNPTMEWLYQKVFNPNQFNFGDKGEILSLKDNTEANLARASFLVKFMASFSNTKYKFSNQVIDGNGDIKSQDADTNNLKVRSLKEWSSELDIQYTENKKTILDTINNKYSTTEDILEVLGFPIILDEVIDSNKKKNVLESSYTFTELTNMFLDEFDKFVESKGKIGDIFKQVGKEPSRINTIATGMVEFIVEYRNDYDNQLYNVEGNMQSSINFNTFQTLTINNLNYVIDLVRDELGYSVDVDTFRQAYLKKLNELYPESLNSFNRDSIWLNNYIATGNKMTMQLIAGTTKNSDGSPTSKLVETDLWSSFLNNTLENNFPAIKHADRGMFPAYSFGYGVTDIFSDIPGNYNPTSNWRDIFKGYLHTYLKSEITRVRKNRDNNKSFIENYDVLGKEFLIFNGILDTTSTDKKHQDKLEALVKSTETDFTANKFVNEQIDKWVEGYFQEVLEEAKETGINQIIPGDGLSTSAVAKLTESLTAKPGTKEFYNEAVELAAAKFFIGAVEQTKLFIGDPAYYKIKGFDNNLKRAREIAETGKESVRESILIYDIIKRANMQSSTKQVSIVDNVTNNFLNGVLKLPEYKIKLSDTEEFFYKKDFNGELTELVISDPETVTAIKDALGKIYSNDQESVKAYTKGFEETDGFAIGNIFFAVESIFRTEGITSSRLELMKRELKALSASKEEINELYTIPAEYDTDEKVIKYMSDVIRPFTQQKFQYIGPNYMMSKDTYRDTPVEDRLGIVAGRKDSYGMLIPSLIKGTILEDLNKFMLRNGIDTIHFGSASKFGAPMRASNKRRLFYKPLVEKDAKGKTVQIAWDGFNDEAIQQGDKGILDFKYLGKQNEIAFEIKEKVTDSTQARKNTLSGIMVNGEYPIDFVSENPSEEWSTLSDEEKLTRSELYKDFMKYEETIKDLVNTLTNELLDKFNIQNKSTLSINDGALFANMIRRQAIDRGSPNNILDAITDWVNKEGGLKFIESLSNYPKIQYILTSLVTNNLLIIKRNGTMLAQAPSTGWETGARTFNDGKIQAGDDLKFYTFEYDEDGNITKVNPAECAMPLPLDKLPALFKRYNTRSITEAIDKLNEDLANGTIKDILVKGLRIPNQQLSSNDVFRVKRFYYPMYTQSVLVPNEIVVKNGSDYDIDKLSLYLPFLDDNMDSKKSSKLEGVKKLQAELLEIEIRMLLHPKRIDRLLKPVTGGALQDTAKEVQKNTLGTKNSVNKPFTDILKIQSLVKSTLEYVGGKQGVGVVATWITFHKLVEAYNVHLKAGNNLPSIFGISNMQSDKGLKFAYTNTLLEGGAIQEVEDVLSSLITSQVDIVKDSYSSVVNIVLDTLNPVCYLVLRGVPTANIINVVNSDIVRDYYKLSNKRKAKSIQGSKLLKSQKKIKEALTKKYAGKTEELAKFGAWLEVEEQANKITDVKSVLSADTKYLKSPSEVQALETLYTKITGPEGIFTKETIDELMRNSLLTPFIESRELIAQWFDQLYITRSSTDLRSKFETLRDNAFQHIRNKETNNKARQRFDENFVNYLIQNTKNNKEFRGNFNKYFTGDNSLPRRILDAKKNPAFENNYLMKQLVVQLDNNLGVNDKKQIDNLKLYMSKLTPSEADNLASAFDDIRLIDEKLYKDLVIFNIFQAGISNSTYQLNKVIPYEAQKEVLNFLGEFNPNSISNKTIADFFVKFFLANPNLLPNKPKDYNIFSPIKKTFENGKLKVSVNTELSFDDQLYEDVNNTSVTESVDLIGGNNAIDYTTNLEGELTDKAKDIEEYLDSYNVISEELIIKPSDKEFDKLPSKSDNQTFTYAGIGSRETPQEVLSIMEELGKELQEKGYTLRSGGAKGADSAFEKYVSNKEIFIGSTKTGDRELKIAREIHPNVYALDNSKNPDFIWNLMARNTNQVFGKNLDTPVDFVIAWTQDGLTDYTKRTIKSGGTGQAIDMASRKGIPVINLKNSNWREDLNRVFENKLPLPKNKQLNLFDNITPEDINNLPKNEC